MQQQRAIQVMSKSLHTHIHVYKHICTHNCAEECKYIDNVASIENMLHCFFLTFLLYSNVFTRTTATAAVAATATSMQREAPKKVPTIVHTRQARQSRRHCLHTKYQIKKYKEIATANINEGKTNNKIPHFLVGKLLNYFCYIV